MTTREIIKSAGLKATLPRIIIYDLLKETGHSSIDDIIERARLQVSEVTVSTVYRILDSFCEVGLISKICHPDGKMIYDITTTEHGHIFSETDGIVDLQDERLIDLVTKYLSNKIADNEEIERVSIKVITRKRM